MPLHLLGKKSWNVYNQDNISRVRKDEADAQARQEAAEQRMQEEDAARRIALLRGETVPPLAESRPDEEERHHCNSRSAEDEDYSTRDRKRKRRNGEDDTDRDIRYAKQAREAGLKARVLLGQVNKGAERSAEAPLQDHAGHIQLFAAPDEKDIRKNQKNAEAEAEKAKKRKREEDLVTMKFSNAAGYSNGMQKPWYAAAIVDKTADKTANKTASRNETMLAELKGNDVWGNEDPRRKERETKKIVSSDPFAAMQNAQRQLKQSEKDKERWQRKQRAELEQLRADQRRHRTIVDDADSPDEFSLDTPSLAEGPDSGSTRRRSKHRHHHHHRRHHNRERDGGSRHRSRSRSRERDKIRHRSRSREREGHRSHRSRHHEQKEVDSVS